MITTSRSLLDLSYIVIYASELPHYAQTDHTDGLLLQDLGATHQN
jgi:hypothetical protein